MITDLTVHGGRYARIHPVFGDAFAFLNSAEPADLPVGAHDKGTFTAVVVETDGKGIQSAPLEYHQRNIDIHVTLTGHDSIGWRPKDLCATPAGEFDTGNDIGFVKDQPQLWIPVPPAAFAVFFPEDAHAPLAGEGPIRKIILKIIDARP
jgi:biofilm protein TabA